MKKFTAILLCVILAFDSFGYMFLYLHRIITIKDSLVISEKKINDDEVKVIPCPKKQSRGTSTNIYVINEYEIMYEGMMYDYFKCEEKDDTIYYYCIYDKKEDIFLKSFSSYVERRTDSNTENIIIYEAISFRLFQQALLNFTGIELIPQTVKNYLPENKFTLCFYLTDVPTPPPKYTS